MDPSNEPREAEHLLHDQPAEAAAGTQDELRLRQQRPLELFKHVVKELSPPSDSNIQYTVLAASKPSEVSSTLASPTSDVAVEKDHTPALNKQHTVLAPWTLRKVPLLGSIACLIIFVVVLEALYSVSNEYQGLVTSEKNIYYLWKYCPTAILSLVTIYWSNLEHHTKISTPWVAMSQEPRPAASSLLFDYSTPNFLVVIWRSARARHFPVLTAAVGALAIIFTTVTSTGLFTLQSIEKTYFDSVDALPVLLVSSILSGNLSVGYPPNTNEQFATESFGIHDLVTGSVTSFTGSIDAFSAGMTCVPGLTLNSSVTATEDFLHVLVDVTDGNCATGLITLTEVERSSYDGVVQTQTLTVGAAILQQCPNVDQPTLFVVFAQVEATAKKVFGNETVETTTDWAVTSSSINSTAIVCTPSYKVQKTLVTTNPQGAFLGGISAHSESHNLSISAWDLWSAVNRSLVAAGPVFIVRPDAHTMQIGGSLYDELFAVMISTFSRSPIEYLNHDSLIHDTQRLFKAVANQIAARYLLGDSGKTTAGSYRATQSRILFLDSSLRVVEAGITIIIVCACLMIAYSPWVPYSIAGDNTAILAVILARSSQLKTSLKGNGIMSHERMLQSLTKHSFACMEHSTTRPDLVQVYGSGNNHELDPHISDCDFWRPSALSKLMRVITIMTPLAIIASLELTYRISHRYDDYGLASIPSDRQWHYAWTWIPALVMTITKLLCRSVTSSISLLDPYSRLRNQRTIGYRAFCRSNLSKPSLQLCFESLQNRRWALLTTSLSALLGPFLTIIVSGLFFIQPTALGLEATFHMADRIVSPLGKYCSSSSWTQASLCAASLLSSGYGVFPRGTYENIVYPLPVPSIGGVEWSEPLLHSTPYQLEWSGASLHRVHGVVAKGVPIWS